MPRTLCRPLPLTVCLLAALAAFVFGPLAGSARGQVSFAENIVQVQPRIVKIFGAGGLRGLEAYQSGFLISAEGHVLTVWSYVLDTQYVTVVLDDGRHYTAELVGADPRLEIAVLKIDAEDLAYFALDEAAIADVGDRVLAFSNLYGVASGNEPASVLHGIVAVKTSLSARRGTYSLRYNGPVYVLDAMTNNPGAAGGALTDRQGRLLGLLGKEVRNEQNGAWLNYAMPIEELRPSIDAILSGETVPRSADEQARLPEFSLSLEALGIVMVPEVLDNTPPFVDLVRGGSPAEEEGLQADDLILFVEGRMVQSCRQLVDEIMYVHRDDSVNLTVLRDEELFEVTLEAPRR